MMKLLLLLIVLPILLTGETLGKTRRNIDILTVAYVYRYTAEEGQYDNLKCLQLNAKLLNFIKYERVYVWQPSNGQIQVIRTIERPRLLSFLTITNITIDVYITAENGTVSSTPSCQLYEVNFPLIFGIVKYKTTCFGFTSACAFFSNTPSETDWTMMNNVCPREKYRQVEKLDCLT